VETWESNGPRWYSGQWTRNSEDLNWVLCCKAAVGSGKVRLIDCLGSDPSPAGIVIACQVLGTFLGLSFLIYCARGLRAIIWLGVRGYGGMVCARWYP
jgi:hypothetical protein